MFLTPVSHSSKLIEPGKGLLEPPIYNQSCRSTDDHLDLWLAHEVGAGAVFLDWALNLYNLMLSQLDSVRISWTGGHPAGVGELFGDVNEDMHATGIRTVALIESWDRVFQN